MKVCLFGGTFDPPHLGHSCLALSILSVSGADEDWVLPCHGHPHAKALSPFHHRIDMCQLAFRHLRPNVRVLKIEKHLPAPNYTAQTLRALKELFPQTHFDWAIGSDLLPELPNWNDAPWLAEQVRFLVVGREGFSMKDLPQGFNIKCFTGLTLPNIASRNLRSAPDPAKPTPGLDKAVWAYAVEKGLYDGEL